MKTYKRFTPEENKIIKDFVRKSKTIKEGLMQAAKALHRGEAAVINHYYYSKEFKSLRISTVQSRKKDKEKVQCILASELRKSPDNLREAFRKVAEKTNKSIKTIEQGYYSNDSYLSRHKIGICYVLSSGKKVFINNKNEVKKEFKDRSGIFDKIRNFFNQLFNNQI